jgi:hypothetical protein
MAAVPDFDLVASSLRAETTDLHAYVEALARKFEDALPQQTVVERRSKAFLSREKVVRKIDVEVAGNRYTCEVDSRGNPETRRAQAVRGIVLKTEPLALDAWIDALARDLAAQAESSEQGRLALERLLI